MTMSDTPPTIQVNLGYGVVIFEGGFIHGQTKAVAWYPSDTAREPGDTIPLEPDDTSYRENGAVFITFKTNDDIDRLIANLQKMRDA